MINLTRFLAIFFTLYAYAAAADEVAKEESMFSFAGFASLGASHSSMNQGDYVLDSTVPKGAGLNSNWAFGNDSRIGAQATATFSPNVTGVVQVISEYQADNTYQPAIEWANVKYVFAPDVFVRVGRTALPTFMNSDSRKVGYSYPWIHPPVDLYRQLSITNSDGIDAQYRFDTGSAAHFVKAVYGENRNYRPTSTSISNDLWGIFETLEYENLTVHGGYQQRQSSSYNLLTGVSGVWVKNSDLSLGVSYDPGNWFLIAEWIQRKSTNKVGAHYVGAGYRFDKFTPYATVSGNSPGTWLPAAGMPTAANLVLVGRAQSTISTGVRWDFMQNVDAKLQYDKVRLENNSNGFLANVPAGVILSGMNFHVVSLVFDVLF